MSNQVQYQRKINILLSNRVGDEIDLGQLRVVFSIKKTDAQTPNSAEIQIYNLNETTSRRIQSEFSKITIQAGYNSNYGVIFSGNIKQVKYGRINGVDSFVDISAGDGDKAYNYAIINATITSGAKQSDQVGVALKSMKGNGINVGFIDDLGSQALPRGKVLYGMARDYLRQSTQSTDTTWSIQDGRVQIVKRSGILPSQAVVLNESSGLIGTPEQTTDGLKARCLLNPLLKVGGRVVLSDKLTSNEKHTEGVYRLLVVDHVGDSFGNDWYSEIVCLNVNESAPVGKQVAKT
jgi:hypothetical protein